MRTTEEVLGHVLKELDEFRQSAGINNKTYDEWYLHGYKGGLNEGRDAMRKEVLDAVELLRKETPNQDLVTILNDLQNKIAEL